MKLEFGPNPNLKILEAARHFRNPLKITIVLIKRIYVTYNRSMGPKGK
jgi:hypothetical protein